MITGGTKVCPGTDGWDGEEWNSNCRIGFNVGAVVDVNDNEAPAEGSI